MIGKDVERKLTVFISSKIDDRYKIVRNALKTLLMETGIVASVYAFENEASSKNTQSAYLNEVSKSDLCIFLIDNADGVSDAVLKEHKQAKSTGIHRLYFFCSERKKDETPLQNELRQAGEIIYKPVNEFSELPKQAYTHAIQDILDWYRGLFDLNSDIDLISNIKHRTYNQTMQASSFIIFEKYIFARYSPNNILVKVLNPYEELSPSEKNSSTSWECLCSDFLCMVIGRKIFSIKIFTQLKNAILSESETMNNITDVIKIRLDAITEFFSGNLSVCYERIHEAYNLIKSKKNIPEWIVNDIALDMRNIDIMQNPENINVHLTSEGQIILNKSAEMVYYPLLDRFAESQKSNLLNEYFEMLTDSPYTNRFGILNNAFNDIASCFNVAVRFGSLTNIRIMCNRYAEVLFTKFADSKDIRLFCELVRLYIIIQDEKSLGKVVKAYRNSVDAITVDYIQVIIDSIETIPFSNKRFESTCLLLNSFGFYMSNEQYKKQENIFFTQSKAWCMNTNSRIVSTGHFILQTAYSIIHRSDYMLILELVLNFFSIRVWRFCHEALKVLRYIKYEECTEEMQTRVMEQLIDLLAMDNMTSNSFLNNAIIQFRLTATIAISDLDKVVKEKNPTFYNDVYYLECGLDNDPYSHLGRYIKEARQRIVSNESGKYYSYSYNPFKTIRNILKGDNIPLTADAISDMVNLIQDTLIDENNQSDTKEGAFALAIYLRNKYPKHKVWKQFTESIRTHERNILNAQFDFLIDGESPNVIQCCYLLLKMSLSCTSFEEVTIGFATMSSYTERDSINVLKCLSNYLSDADIDVVDKVILGVILNFVLSIGEDKHSDILYFTILALLELIRVKGFATAVLIRLSYLMVNADSNIKTLILRKVSETEYVKTDIGQYILQNGRISNHYGVRKLASESQSK